MVSVNKISTSDEFKKLASSNNLLVLHFAADWAPQCLQVTDVMTELANLPELKTSGTQFCVCPAEDLSEIALKYKVEAVPTVVLIRNEKLVDRIDGVDVISLTAKVKKHSFSAFSPIIPETNGESLEDRLKKLINKHNIMVFMKGNRDTPRCGFSRTLIGILQDVGVQYETFDILNDEEVRQGLKTFSNWPTYPQVYVKGELIGGLDIIKEMQQGGELESTLKS